MTNNNNNNNNNQIKKELQKIRDYVFNVTEEEKKQQTEQVDKRIASGDTSLMTHDEIDQTLNKMVLYQILSKSLEPGEKEYGYEFQDNFLDYVCAIGEVIDKAP